MTFPCASASSPIPSAVAARHGSSTSPVADAIERSPDRHAADEHRAGHRGEEQTARRDPQLIGEHRRKARQASVAERDQRHRD